MKKIDILIAMSCLIAIVGCISQPICEKPYTTIGGKCCLDLNENNICDDKETTTTSKTIPSVTTTLAQGICNTDKDCKAPQSITDTFCSGRNIVQDMIIEKCVDSKCVGERNRTTISTCKEGETCVNLNCVPMPKPET